MSHLKVSHLHIRITESRVMTCSVMAQSVFREITGIEFSLNVKLMHSHKIKSFH